MILFCFGELDDLAGIKAAVSGKDEADHAYQRKQMKICAPEHHDAQSDGSEGGIGGTAEKSHKPQCTAQTCENSTHTAHDEDLSVLIF